MTGPSPLNPLPPLPAPLSADERAALRRFRTRRALVQSAEWERLGPRAEGLAGTLLAGVPSRPAPRPPRTFLRVATWNVQRGLRLDALLEVLRQEPFLQDLDALCLNEVDLGMARSGNRHVAREVAEALGFGWVFGNSYVCLDLGDERDGAPEGENELGLHGNAILSRWPLSRAENVSLPVTRDKFQSSEKRLGAKRALWADLATPLGTLRLATAHLDSVASTSQRAAQLTALLEATGREHPLLLGGDLNTHTYDVSSTWALVRNLWAKLWRGGFPHGVEHYMRPWEIYEAPVFAALQAAGLAWREFNDLGRGSLRYTVGTFECESSVREHLPAVAVPVLRWKLKPWGGVCPLRMDWFAGRGVRALSAGERRDGRESLPPRSVEAPRAGGVSVSDHDPLVVDVSLP